MGMGVAGSYLMARLKDTEHEVTGYELRSEEAHDSICAWGTIKPVLQQFMIITWQVIVQTEKDLVLLVFLRL